MSFKELAQKGINGIRKTNQQHQMPASSLELFGRYWKKKNCIYGLCWSIDRIESIDFIEKLSYTIDSSSCINILTEDPFVEHNLKQELKYLKNVKVNGFNMNYDLSAGNPIFYERSARAMDSRTGSKLVYDKHIMNAVNHMSGAFKNTGPYITDTTWFQGGANQGKFRDWLFDKKFGLKTVVLLPSEEFDVDSDKTELCMFVGEIGYQGDITIIDYSTKEQFTYDFRKIGYIIKNKDLAMLLPQIQTDTKYEWKRTKIELKLDKSNGAILKGPLEVKNGKIKVLKKVLLNQKPEFYYTSEKYINDWTDVNETRFVTGYNAGSTHADYYKILKGLIIPPGVVIPGDMWFTYTVIKKKDAKKHKEHLLSLEVQQILKHTRTGKSLHTPQTIWIPYITEFKGFTNEQKEILSRI